MIDTSAGRRAKCPRCGAVQDEAALSQDDQPVDAGTLVSDMLETQEQAEQRHRLESQAAAERAERERREAHFAHQRHATERFNRLGGKTSGGKSFGWVVGVFAAVVGAFIGYRALVGFFDARKADQAAAEQLGAFASIDGGDRVSGAVARWVRSLAAGITTYQPYHVSFDKVEQQGDGLLLVEGALHAADRALTDEQIAARIDALRQAKSDRSATNADGAGTVSGGELQQGVGVIRDSYDPQRMEQIATGRRDMQVDADAGEQASNGAAETLRSMGFEMDDAVAGDAQEIVRPFMCVVRRDSDTESFAGGVAMEYFVWAHEAHDGSVRALDDAQEQQSVAKVINYVLESLRDDGDGWRTYVNASGRRTSSDLFPVRDRPAAWTIARSDRNARNVVRAFVRVKTQTPERSGTWIIAMMRIGSDGGYRIVDVWRPSL
jgi:hypothetical protein